MAPHAIMEHSHTPQTAARNASDFTSLVICFTIFIANNLVGICEIKAVLAHRIGEVPEVERFATPDTFRALPKGGASFFLPI